MARHISKTETHKTITTVGHVTSLSGEVVAVAKDGSVRKLSVGDPVYLNDTLKTGDGGAVALDLNHKHINLGDHQALALDTKYLASILKVDNSLDAAAMVEAVKQTIALGGDVGDVLPAPGAGRAGAGSSNSIAAPVYVMANPYAGFEYNEFLTSGLTQNNPNVDPERNPHVLPGNSEVIADVDLSPNAVAENAPNGTAVGITLSNSDPTLKTTYTLTNDAGGRFAIDPKTGVVTVANGSLLDYEVATSHNITVLATNSDGSTSTNVITINLRDVNDNTPIITSNGGGASTSISVAENSAAVTTVRATDADATAQLTYTIIGGVDASKFTINSSTGTLRFLTAPDAEAPSDVGANNVYDVIVQVSDGINVDTQTIAVTVTNTNDNSPVINNVTVSLNENIVAGSAVTNVNDAFTGTDLDRDGAAITYSITGGNAAGIFAIDAATGAITIAAGQTLDYETANSHSLTITASDGTSSDTAVVTVNVNNLNDNAPSIADVTTSLNENIAAGSAVTNVNDAFTGTDLDRDGAVITYSITGGNGAGVFTIDATTGAITIAAGQTLDYETASSHNLTVTASDGTLSDTAVVTVNVNNLNDNPVVLSDSDASSNSVTENAANGTVVGITALGIDGDAGATVTYTLTDDAGGRFAIDSNTGVVTVADGSLLDYESVTSHNITVLATSSDGSTQTSTLAIAVTDVNDNNPVITSDGGGATANISVNEGSATVADVDATDADTGDTLTYSLTGGADQSLFTINSSTGVLTFIAAPDYENPLDAGANNIYEVTVTVTDGIGGVDTQTLNVTVNDLNEGVPVANPDSITLSEGGTVTSLVGGATSVLANDGGLSDAPITVTLGAGPAHGSLTLNSDGTFSYNHDGSENFNDSFTYVVTDGTGDTDTGTVNITVTPVNDNPIVLTDSDLSSNSTVENATNGSVVGITALGIDGDAGATVTYTLTDDAGGRFAIDSNTGVVTVADGSLLDYESATSHNITVLATSSDGSTNSQSFAINLSDTNEFSVSAIVDTDAASNSVAENVANGTVVGITAFASDADAINNTITYSLSDDAGGRFAIDSVTGVITVLDGSLLDYESAASHSVTVLATSTDSSTSSQAFTINLTDTNEFTVSAIIDTSATANSVVENAANGTVVGITAFASDADATNNTITYSLSDDAGGRFAIDSVTGVITVLDSSLLDYESATSHSVTVLATSSDGSSNSQSFTINVTNVNDNAPVAVGDTLAATEDTAVIYTAAQLIGNDTDADGNTLTISSVTAGANGSVVLNGDGTVTFTPNPDFNGLADFTYTASDGSLISAPATVIINVAAVDDASVLTADSNTVNEDNSASGNVLSNDSDIDNVLSVATFTVAGDLTTYNAGDTATIAGVGDLTLNSNGSYTFVPVLNYNGSVPQATYTTNTGSSSTLDINVTAQNDAPVANDDVASTPLNTSLNNITVLANDTDAENDTLIVTGATLAIPAQGSITVNPDNTLNFIPALNVSGPILINYSISDGNGGSSSAVLTVNVGSNTAPTGADNTVTTNEDTGRAFAAADFGFSDADVGQTLQAVRIDALPTFGGLTLSGNPVSAGDVINASDLNNLVFTPALNGNGSNYTSFTFSVQDNLGGFDITPNTITFDVTAINDAAVITGTSTANLTETNAIQNTGGSLSATDVDGSAAFVAQTGVAGDNGYGTFSIDAAGVWTYAMNTAHNEFVGGTNYTDSITVATADGTTQVITVTIAGSGETPIITSSSSVNVAENTTTVMTVTATDADVPAETLTYSIVGGADAAFFDIDGSTGALTFKAAPDFENALDAGANNVYDVTVRVTDSGGLFNDQAIIVNITDQGPDLPIVSPVGTRIFTENDLPTAFLSSVGISDQDSASLDQVVVTIANYQSLEDVFAYSVAGTSVSVVGTAGVGTYTLTLTGGADINEYLTVLQTITYENTSDDPDATPRTVTVDAYDDTATLLFGSNTGSITITPVNDAPVATDNSRSFLNSSSDGLLSIAAPTDVDSASVTITVTGLPTTGTVTLSNGTAVSNGQVLTIAELTSLQFDAGGVDGTSTFTYTVDDGLTTDTGVTTIVVGNTTADAGTVYESALSAGSGSDIGGSVTATGNVLSNDAIGPTAITSVVYKGVTYTDASDGSTDGFINLSSAIVDYGSLQLDISGAGAGAYTYTLDTAANVNAASVDEVFTYNFTAPVVGNNTLTITVQDDEPFANNNIEQIPESAVVPFSLVFTLDVSGSMIANLWDNNAGDVADNPNSSTNTGLFSGAIVTDVNSDGNYDAGDVDRLDVAVAALKSLAAEYYEQSGSVETWLVTFGSTASVQNGGASYASLSDFNAALDAIEANYRFVQASNGTNYVAAQAAMQTAFDTALATTGNGSNPDTQFISYFLSDGAPSGGASTPTLPSPWNAYMNGGNAEGEIITSYAVGIGSGVNATYLNDMHNIDAYGRGNGYADNALIVADETQLTSELLSTVPTTFGGSLLSDGSISTVEFGADGGFIGQITIDFDPPTGTQTITFDGTTVDISAVPGATVSGTTVTLDAAADFPYGTLTFDFSDGSYILFAAAGNDGTTFDIDYEVVDGDGDTDSATATVLIVDADPEANDDLDTIDHFTIAEGNVITGVGTDGGVRLGANFTPFAPQGSGIDKIVDDADVSQITYKGATLNLDGTSPAPGGTLTVTYNSEVVDGVTIYEVQVDDSADGTSLIFRSNGYYEYTPSYVSGTATPVVVTTTSAANVTASNLTITGTPFYSANGVGVTNDQINANETLTINFMTKGNLPNGVQDVILDFNGTGGNDGLTITAYATDLTTVLYTVTNANTGDTTITAAQATNIGMITITGTNGGGSNVNLFDVTYTTSDPTPTTGLAPVEIMYTLTDSDGQSDTGLLNIVTVDNTITGTVGDDALNGTANNDAISGDNGNDTINGNAGNDALGGGDGVDIIHGNAGLDNVSGGAGNDSLYGDDGDDYLFGGDGDDYLEGNADNDTLNGGAGSDSVYGGAGNDALYGGTGNDLLDGGDGADTLDGDSGDNTIYGRAGNDILSADEGLNFFYGGSGNDTITGGTDRDNFVWQAGDNGSILVPAVDIITNFSMSDGDVLNLSSILVGEDKTDLADLSNFINFSDDGTNTTINIDVNGDTGGGFQTTQSIVLQGVTMQDLAGGMIGPSNQDILNNLLVNNQLATD